MNSPKISTAVLYGLIAGLLLIGLTFGTYEGGIRVFISPVSYLGYVILIALAIAAALVEKKRGGGYLEFRDAVKASFTVFVIGLALQTLFYWLLLHVIDTHFQQALAQAIQVRTIAAMRSYGWTEDAIQRAIADEKGSDQFSPGRTLTGLALIYIVLFLVSLLIAAMVRRKKQAGQTAGV
ncbi:MAG TPA: DUF4199 domain-containing protein [Puia sp.]|jgi:hypothetical protein|nr:DUF4199 domain-containing protein [Puia sp.]